MEPATNAVSFSNNAHGANQHGQSGWVTRYPNLPARIQELLNSNYYVKEIPQALCDSDLKIEISERSVKRIISKYKLKTVRKNTMTIEEKAYEILKATREDAVQGWGSRLIKERLASDGVHIAREDIEAIRKHENPAAVAARHPRTRKVHSHGLFSAGPNEEWCLDGNEKIFHSMGIAIYGINDMYSRRELILIAVPNARSVDVPTTVYLQTVKKFGGMPVMTTSDMGTEVSKLIPMVETLRALVQPMLPENLPAFRTTKSTFNITRERAWGPLYKKELSNVLCFYNAGKIRIGYQEDDQYHRDVALWVWSKVVQDILDRYLIFQQNHRIRFQKNSLLPTGGQPINFFEHPERWNGTNLLVEVPNSQIEEFQKVYDKPEALKFGNQAIRDFCEQRYAAIGAPELKSYTAWVIFATMLGLTVPADWESVTE
ncbi:hypothetical protein BJ165DRAFT_1598800 [Panaeolus papilionaceus]|nr:hypothetical protein BJ165DRAFT_1598800 [Panaeolus papilionaceus]